MANDDRPSSWSTDLPSDPIGGSPDDAQTPTPSPAPAPSSTTNRRVVGTRRSFLRWSGIAALGAGTVAVGAKVLSGRGAGTSVATEARSAITLPPTSATLPGQLAPVTSTADLAVDGITPLITPTSEFFRIDVAFSTPRIDPATWRLQIGGKVDAPLSFSYDDLLSMPQVSAPITVACVSNDVGGDLIGTAVWQGVELRTLLERAGVQAGGDQIVGRSVDGFTVGFPTDVAFDGRAAVVALGMNGEPLPIVNGFPARLVVEGLFGYVSATKWLHSIELHGWNDFDGYWIQQGWAKDGPILMSSRIDVPRIGQSKPAGNVTIAGVAWAPDSGVRSVQVRIDEGPWRECTLGEELSGGVWRQWAHDWDATPGDHRVEVRCIDAKGRVQTGERTARPIAGETGWHSRIITID